MFRQDNEPWGEIPVHDTSVKPKIEYLCSCGATRFKWVVTEGVIRAGGFKPETYTYECLGCGRRHTEEDIKKYFGKF